MMWPEAVERIASFVRESQAQARLEELPPGVETAPGPAVRADAFDCDGRAVVVVVAADAAVDHARVRQRAGCRELRPAGTGSFPYQGALVYVDRALMSLRTVWVEAGSPRHVLGLGPRQLLRLTRADTGSFVRDD
jgi:prolyl-tRNA editing enzyme YbaK/EbsC (Cys-tRNA(Pro) deacylase)